MNLHVLSTVFAIPMAVGIAMLWIMDPKTKKQWIWCGGAVIYIALYVAIFHYWLKTF